jgi:hypothetical protein
MDHQQAQQLGVDYHGKRHPWQVLEVTAVIPAGGRHTPSTGMAVFSASQCRTTWECMPKPPDSTPGTPHDTELFFCALYDVGKGVVHSISGPWAVSRRRYVVA